MTFCHRCGAPSSGAAACAACGAAVAVPATPGPGDSPSSQPRGPTGKPQSPRNVVLLALVTLGIYGFVYWWRVSKETDAYTNRPGHAHSKVKLGILLQVAMMAAAIVGTMFMAAAVFASVTSGSADEETVALGGIAGSALIMILATGLGITGAILLMVGQWRVWTMIREDQQRRAHPSPLSPGLMLAFLLIPYINIVTMWIALHQTQKGLNDVWSAAAGNAGAESPLSY